MKRWALLLLFFPRIVFGQLFDNTWLFGYQIGVQDTADAYGITMITFPEGKLKSEKNHVLSFNMSETNTSFSDSSGNVLSYTNAVHIGNAAWEIMDGGEYLTDAFEAGGGLWCQWVVILPRPGSPDKQVYLYEREGYTSELSVHATTLYSAIIDMSHNAGSGKVVERDILVLEDTLAVGKINAVRHANGRDWWVIVNEKNSNRFYRILVDINGIRVVGNQTIGVMVVDGVGQAGFSPNGKHYFIYGTVSSTQGAYIDLYDFDRCEGLFYNHRQHQ